MFFFGSEYQLGSRRFYGETMRKVDGLPIMEFMAQSHSGWKNEVHWKELFEG